MPAGRVVLWVASIGAVALLTVRSLLARCGAARCRGRGAFAGYLALILVGVLVPQLSRCSATSSRAEIVTTEAVALTFDDGPHPVTTRRVLEILAGAGVTATFFVVGEKAEKHPDVVREIADGGTLARRARLSRMIGCTRFCRRARSRTTSSALQTVVERACWRQVPLWFRPPVGQVSPRTVAGARSGRMPIVAWSVRGLDGLASADSECVCPRASSAVSKPGAIVLLHDAAERDDFTPAAVEALPNVLSAIAAKKRASRGAAR